MKPLNIIVVLLFFSCFSFIRVENHPTHQTITLVTSNERKLREIKEIIPCIVGKNIDLPEVQSIDPYEVISHKIQAALNFCPEHVMVEDTSLHLDCLAKFNSKSDLPGPLIKWFSKTLGNRKLAEVATRLGNTKAQLRSLIAYAINKNEIYYFEGVMYGQLIIPKTSEHNFDCDFIFVADGYTVPLGNLTITEKNKISMRGKAARKLQKFLYENTKNITLTLTQG